MIHSTHVYNGKVFSQILPSFQHTSISQNPKPPQFSTHSSISQNPKPPQFTIHTSISQNPKPPQFSTHTHTHTQNMDSSQYNRPAINLFIKR